MYGPFLAPYLDRPVVSLRFFIFSPKIAYLSLARPRCMTLFCYLSSAAQNVLEIGVFDGASLSMWQRLFPNHGWAPVNLACSYPIFETHLCQRITKLPPKPTCLLWCLCVSTLQVRVLPPAKGEGCARFPSSCHAGWVATPSLCGQQPRGVIEQARSAERARKREEEPTRHSGVPSQLADPPPLTYTLSTRVVTPFLSRWCGWCALYAERVVGLGYGVGNAVGLCTSNSVYP
jgi:hypothetical protein